MFFGEYEHSLDEKNRIILPSKFREIYYKSDVPKFYMTRGFDECLALYLEQDFQTEIKKLKEKPYHKKDVRAFNRLLLSRTIETTCDKQGRILIPEKFKDSSGISKEIILVGVWNKIEIWDKGKWSKFNDDNSENFETIAEELFDNVRDDGE